MDNDNNKRGGLHINIGGLIIVVIILLILFKVDIKEKIQSPQFQKNITYVEDFFKDIWNNKLKGKVDNTVDDLTKDLVNTGVEGIQKTVNSKLDEIKQ